MIGVVVWKELRETVRDRSALSSGLSVLLLLALLNVASLRHAAINVGHFIFYVTPCIGLMTAFGMSGRFTREKRERVIETLLATPLTLRELWLGKVVGLTIPSYAITLAAALTLMYVRSCAMNSAIAIYLFLVIPALIASAVGLLGLLQYALGMRQVQALNYAVFFTLFVLLFVTVRTLAMDGDPLAWEVLSALLIISVLLLGVAAHLVSRLDKERVVTTVD